MLRLKAKYLDIEPKCPLVVMNTDDAKEIGANNADRVLVTYKRKSKIVIVETTDTLVAKGDVGLNRRAMKYGIRTGDMLHIDPAEKPVSVEYIKKKLKGTELTKKECEAIIDDINDNKINDIELGAYVSSIYMHDFTDRELIYITRRMIDTGATFSWKGDNVVDKHSIGGVPGNRVTPIIVAIATSCGLLMPKTSSRAITSPAGTADTLEVWCNVDQPVGKIHDIVEAVGGCFVWGGNMDIAPTDDKIIHGEYPLSVDPEGQLLASVMAKKAAMGAKAVVIDIPFGFESKVETLSKARSLAKRFKNLGKSLGMKIDCAVTRGEQPIGRGIGPVLECIDIMAVLEGKGPKDLREKSIELSGILLKLTRKGNRKTAEDILDSGRAMAQFRDIVKIQEGNPDINLNSLLGKNIKTIKANRAGKVTRIYNRRISRTARIAGAPKDKGAGIYMHVKLDDFVNKGDRLFDIYAEKKFKLDHATKICMENFPVDVEDRDDMLIEEI